MFEKEDQPEPLRALIHVIRRLASAGSAQPTLFPDENVSPGDLVRDFDQRASAVRDANDASLSPSQLDALTVLQNKLTRMSRDGAEFDADIWTDDAVRTSEHWAEIRRLAAATIEEFSQTEPP